MTKEATIDKLQLIHLSGWKQHFFLLSLYKQSPKYQIKLHMLPTVGILYQPQALTAPLSPWITVLLYCNATVDCIRGGHEWAIPLRLEDYNLAAKPRDNQNFLSLGVVRSIEKSFKFCQFLPVDVDNLTVLQPLSLLPLTIQWCLWFWCCGRKEERSYNLNYSMFSMSEKSQPIISDNRPL